MADEKSKKELSLKKQVKERVAAVAAVWLKDLDRNIRDKMESALLSLLGLNRNYYNSLEIDHCSGRNSVFIDIIREKAKKDAAKLVGNLKLDPEAIKQFKEAFIKEYKDRFRSEIYSLSRAKAETQSKEMFDELFEKELKKQILE